jgi:hypothetical protein
MSGVNYSNASIHKSDLLLIENYAASLGGGGGGGSSKPICFTATQTVSTTIPSATSDVLLSFNSFNGSPSGFVEQDTQTFRWNESRTGVFIAKFVARATNSNALPSQVRIAVQIMTGNSGSPTALVNGAGVCLVSGNSSPETTTEANLVLITPRFSLNNGQVIQVRAGQSSSNASGVAFDGVNVTTTPRTFDSPSYTLFVQEVL